MSFFSIFASWTPSLIGKNISSRKGGEPMTREEIKDLYREENLSIGEICGAYHLDPKYVIEVLREP